MAAGRGLHETQKLLAHLLGRLEIRGSAPDLLDRASVGAREASGNARGKGKGRATRVRKVVLAAAQSGLAAAHNSAASSNTLGAGSDDLDEQIILEDGEWDTEATYDLVEQTRGLLVLADRQKLDLFSSPGLRAAEVSVTPVRGKRRAGRFSSIISPISTSKPSLHQNEDTLPQSESTVATSGTTLLTRMLHVLRTLIASDCLHRTHLFRPLCPPNGLQAACIDIATYLYHKCEIVTKLNVMDIVVNGYHTMGDGMTERICEWLEGRLGELLGRLSKERGGPSKPSTNQTDPFMTPVASQLSVPTIALPTESQDSPAAATPGWMRFSPIAPSFPFTHPLHDIAGTLSTHSTDSETSSTGLHIASLVTRILAAISMTVDLTASKLSTIHRVHRLLSLVLIAKPDAALDLLEISAVSHPKARRTAVEILSTFYPESMGHNVIARRLASTTYLSQRTKWETGLDVVLGEDAVEDHHYTPWRVSPREEDSISPVECSVCSDEVHGFCIRCSLCRDVKHLACHQSSEQSLSFNVVRSPSQKSTPRTVTIKLSHCIRGLVEQALQGRHAHGDERSTHRRVGQHELRLINLFDLTLCCHCREPLWGSTKQAYVCLNGCQRMFHPRCANFMAREQGQSSTCKYGRDLVIEETSMRERNPFTISEIKFKASFDREVSGLYISDMDLSKRSYDEVAVVYGALWTQYHILKNGMISGALQIFSKDQHRLESDLLDLRPRLIAYEEHLQSHRMEASTAASDFAHVSSSRILGLDYMFSDRYLTYCAALLRTPLNRSITSSTSEGLLTAQGFPAPPELADSMTAHGAYEVLEVATIKRSMASDLNIHDNRTAALFFDHLRSTGLCTTDAQSIIFPRDFAHDRIWVYFGLPLLMDSSPTVELLILSIEAMLVDLDLALNEQAFNLLSSRAWPSLLSSPYALERLGNAVVSWVMEQVSLKPRSITHAHPK